MKALLIPSLSPPAHGIRLPHGGGNRKGSGVSPLTGMSNGGIMPMENAELQKAKLHLRTTAGFFSGSSGSSRGCWWHRDSRSFSREGDLPHTGLR